jgi:hypothetical protein
VPIPRDEALQHDRHRTQTFRHCRRTPAAPPLDTEIERQPFDDRRQISPQRAAVLELAEDGVVVFEESQLHEAAEVFLLDHRQVSPPSRRPYDLIDEIEMVEEQPLIIHSMFL